jgi:hypothetical protein
MQAEVTMTPITSGEDKWGVCTWWVHGAQIQLFAVSQIFNHDARGPWAGETTYTFTKPRDECAWFVDVAVSASIKARAETRWSITATLNPFAFFQASASGDITNSVCEKGCSVAVASASEVQVIKAMAGKDREIDIPIAVKGGVDQKAVHNPLPCSKTFELGPVEVTVAATAAISTVIRNALANGLSIAEIRTDHRLTCNFYRQCGKGAREWRAKAIFENGRVISTDGDVIKGLRASTGKAGLILLPSTIPSKDEAKRWLTLQNDLDRIREIPPQKLIKALADHFSGRVSLNLKSKAFEPTPQRAAAFTNPTPQVSEEGAIQQTTAWLETDSDSRIR